MDAAILQRLEDYCSAMADLVKSEELEEQKNRRSELEKEFSSVANEYVKEHPDEKPEIEKIRKKFEKLDKTFSAALFQLYQARDLERWEHYALKLQICKELTALSTLPDEKLPEIAKKIKELREHWNRLGTVPHEKSEEVWNEFRTKINGLNHRVNVYFSALNVERNAVDEAKKALLEEAVKLCENPNFAAITPKLKEIQAKWKVLGVGHIKVDRALFAEFRTLCDGFFAARNKFFSERKSVVSEALECKRQLIERAETLKEVPASQLRRESQNLYREWRNAPYAGKEDQRLYDRFKAAIDSLFEAQHEMESESLNAKFAVCDEIGVLAAQLAAGEVELKGGVEQYSALCRKFNSAGEVSGDGAFKAENRRKAECSKVEKLLGELHLKSFFAGSSVRLEAEKALAIALEADEVGEIEPLVVVFAETAGQQSAEEIRKLAQRNAELRRRTLEDYANKRRFAIGSLENKLGLESSLNDNVQLLALALESAIRGNFAAAQERFTAETAKRFEQEYLAVPLASSNSADEIYASFEKALKRLLDRISTKS